MALSTQTAPIQETSRQTSNHGKPWKWNPTMMGDTLSHADSMELALWKEAYKKPDASRTKSWCRDKWRGLYRFHICNALSTRKLAEIKKFGSPDEKLAKKLERKLKYLAKFEDKHQKRASTT